MAFNTDYASFRTAVPLFLDWSDSTTTRVDDLITIAEKKVYRLLRTRANEAALAATITSAGTAAVPSDYEEMKSARIDASPVRKLTRTSVEDIYERFADRAVTGGENYFAREGDNFIFGPAGTTDAVMKGIYYRSGTLMAVAGTINSIFTAHPDIFLMAAASESAAFIGTDERMAVWDAKFKELLAIANQEARDEGLSGSSISGRLG